MPSVRRAREDTTIRAIYCHGRRCCHQLDIKGHHSFLQRREKKIAESLFVRLNRFYILSSIYRTMLRWSYLHRCRFRKSTLRFDRHGTFGHVPEFIKGGEHSLLQRRHGGLICVSNLATTYI